MLPSLTRSTALVALSVIALAGCGQDTAGVPLIRETGPPRLPSW